MGKIYPTYIKKYSRSKIKKKGDSYVARVDLIPRTKDERIIYTKKNIISYDDALHFIRKTCKKYDIKIKNMIHDRGDYYECELTKGQMMKFDKDDLDKVQKHLIHACYNNGYWSASTYLNGKAITFSNIIMGHNPSLSKVTVDHIIPSDSLNNMKSNLRLATKSQQCVNRRIGKNNTSGIKGVAFEKADQRWRATWIDENGKDKNKSFSIKKFGDNAKRMAEEYRNKMVNECDNYHILR